MQKPEMMEVDRVIHNESSWREATWQQLLDESNRAFEQGDYYLAEEIAKKVLSSAEEASSEKDVAVALHNLATIHMYLGRYQEAAFAYSQALAIKERLGEQGSALASTLNQLAQVYSEMGRLTEAEQLYVKALATVEKIGDKQTQATALSNLATVYVQQGRLIEAEALYLKALEIQKTSSDQDAGRTYNNLGNLYFNLHDLGKAQSYFQKALKLMESTYGPEHPDTSWTQLNLAHVLKAEGENEQASALFHSSLHRLRRALGSEHPSVKQLTKQEE